MSRCFPYPPPGYTLSGARNEAALIESIKFQKEKERKLERKEKKERRKEKKAKRKERKARKKEKNEKANLNPGESDIQKLLISAEKSSIQKHDISPKSFSNRKIEALQKKRAAENNQSEQSSLTEEQALPSSLFIPSSSSESTENSKKRKRQSPPEDDTHSQEPELPTNSSGNHQNLQAEDGKTSA
ncbi:Unknown protein [Striga hermonthica]|uniref:Uncharacterized protein n=1 Tax=Striga hermonthica TaxID=68872 RepID=A0A9N7MRU8_STRHE|nr:Unknown protein [Striga hermonthica]